MEEFSFGTLSAGARYDDNEDFASAFSPRIAWTKAMDKFHFKAIYGMGFRSPGIDNLTANPRLKPEKSKTTELETGYLACTDVYLTADVFDMRIDDPIVFYTSGAGQEYGNYGHTGTRGFELSAKVKKNWGYANLSYSYYVAYDNKVDFYDSGVSGTLLAFARGKAALSASFSAARDLVISPSAVYYSGRRGYTAANTVTDLGDVALVNLYIARKNLLRGRLELGFGVYNVFNAPYSYIQPYDGGHSPLPALSREFRTRAAYRF
jgi:outer membrane cobalamin receptor